jgi:hypothetical protein
LLLKEKEKHNRWKQTERPQKTNKLNKKREKNQVQKVKDKQRRRAIASQEYKVENIEV